MLRSIITQLRAGCLPIEIELGRYQIIPRDQRLCKQCTQNNIENELQFIFYCPKFDQIRHDLLSSLNATCGSNASDAEKIKWLFTSNLLLKTGKFIIDALKVRSTLIMVKFYSDSRYELFLVHVFYVYRI